MFCILFFFDIRTVIMHTVIERGIRNCRLTLKIIVSEKLVNEEIVTKRNFFENSYFHCLTIVIAIPKSGWETNKFNQKRLSYTIIREFDLYMIFAIKKCENSGSLYK